MEILLLPIITLGSITTGQLFHDHDYTHAIVVGIMTLNAIVAVVIDAFRKHLRRTFP